MSTKKLRPEDRHITASECQALIVHTLNQFLVAMGDPAPYQDVNTSDVIPTDNEGAE